MRSKDLAKILILLGIAALLISIALFLPKIKKKEKKEVKRTTILNLEENKVDKFKLVYDGKEIVSEKDDKGKWFVVSPKRYEGDEIEMIANIKNFNSLAFGEMLTNIKNPSKYGFDNVQTYFEVWANGKKHKIEVGDKTFNEKGYYVRYNDEYFQIESILILALQKDLKMLRNKNFLDIDMVDIQTITIDDKYIFRKISRSDATFNMIEHDALNVDKVFMLFQNAGQIKAINFTEENPKPFYYGFDPGDIHIELELVDKTRRELYFSTLENKVYAKEVGKKDIFEIDKRIYESFSKNLIYYKKTDKERKLEAEIKKEQEKELKSKSEDIFPLKK